MKIGRTVVCSLCHNGFQFSPNTGKFLACTLCKGVGLVTPDNVCFCGASCNTVTEGYATCGDPKCVEGFKTAARVNSYTTGWHSHNRQNGYMN